MGAAPVVDRVLAAVDAAADELVAFTSDLIRIPTVNPPGESYEDCARLIGDRLARVRLRGRVHRRRRASRTHAGSSARQRRRPPPRTGARGPPSTSTATSTSCRPAPAGRSIPFGGDVARRPRLRPRRLRHEGGHRRRRLRGRSDPPRRRRAATARSRSAAPSTKRAAASPVWPGWRSTGGSAPTARTSSSFPSRSTSTASASATAASTGSRSRRTAASATAACRFSASAPSTTWASSSTGCGATCCRRSPRARPPCRSCPTARATPR